MLFGALAVGIPIALHFFFRSRYRTVPWAAMKFLLTSVEQTSRRLRFQELLLLLLRCLVVATLALALAQPGCRVTPGSGRGGEPVDAVFLFDVSLSMGASDGPVSRLERAKSEAIAILDRLPAHSTARIVTCTDRAVLLDARAPANLDLARDLIGSLQLTSQASDLYPGILESKEVLRRGQNGNHELYLFSDMQKLGWEQQSAALTGLLKEMHGQTSIYLVRCGNPLRKLANAAIVGITPQAGVPRPGERVGFAILVRNTGGKEVKNLKVTLKVKAEEEESKDHPVESQTIDTLPPGEIRAVTLTAKLDKPGLRLLSAELGADDLPGDNRFDQVVLVRDTVNVLVIDGGIHDREPERSSSYFLAHALTPVPENARAKYYLQPKITSPRLAAPALLAKQDLCILVNVPLPGGLKQRETLPVDFLQELEKFVRQGKGLIIYGGDNVAAEPYNRLLGQKHGLLPLPLKGFAEYPVKDKNPIKLNRGSAGIPAYLVFKEDNYYKALGDTTIWKTVVLEDLPKADPAAKPPTSREPGEGIGPGKKLRDPVAVALRYSNDLPAVATKKVDAGEVVFIATSADPGYQKDSPDLAWNDLPFNSVNVPFINLTVSHLLQEQNQVFNIIAGQQFDWQLPPESGKEVNQRFLNAMAPDLTPEEEKMVMKWASAGLAGRNFSLRRPDASEMRLGYPERRPHLPDQLVLPIADLPTAGIYRLGFARTGQQDLDNILKKKVGLPFAVIPDLRDSENLESYSNDQLNGLLGFTPIHRTAGSEEGASFDLGSDSLRRLDWTPWFFLLTLLLAAGEVVLAWICSRAW